ncbi:MAG: hypothetical protein QRY74_02310 [Chlamydia sp.]
MHKKNFFRLLLTMLSIALLSQGCYRMPDEGEVSVVPITNNPSVTRQTSSPLLPGFN